MDDDISAAATSLDLQKIRAQDSRDLAAFNRGQYPALDAAELLEFRRNVIIALIPKYMTTGTATDPAAVLDDAKKDAARLAAALGEVMKLA